MGRKITPEPAYLDDEERNLMESFESGKWRLLDGKELEAQTKRLQTLASETIDTAGLKTERMNIRMSAADLRALKRHAYREGIPYQSLVASVLHKYTMGRLVDVTEVKKAIRAG
jgi:predicted DNA binding CopG/RHH family protein